jgi:hypothetical protein
MVSTIGFVSAITTVHRGLQAGWWMFRYGMTGPLTGALAFDQSPGLPEFIAVVGWVGIWALYARYPRWYVFILVILAAILWGLLGWSVSV